MFFLQSIWLYACLSVAQTNWQFMSLHMLSHLFQPFKCEIKICE